MKTVEVTDLPTHLDSVLAELNQTRDSFFLTEQGEPIAEIKPLAVKQSPDAPGEDPFARFRFPGTIEIVGDILAPLYTDEELEGFFEESMRQIEGR